MLPPPSSDPKHTPQQTMVTRTDKFLLYDVMNGGELFAQLDAFIFSVWLAQRLGRVLVLPRLHDSQANTSCAFADVFDLAATPWPRAVPVLQETAAFQRRVVQKLRAADVRWLPCYKQWACGFYPFHGLRKHLVNPYPTGLQRVPRH